MTIPADDPRLPPARDGGGDLFPVYTAQIAGFVINPDGIPCALRWSAAHDDGCLRWCAAEQSIRYRLPPLSVPLLADALRAPNDAGIAVQCLLPDGGRRYVGTFDVTDVGPTEVVLTLRGDGGSRGGATDIPLIA